MDTNIRQVAVLPVQPKRRQDEWLETYLGRVVRANGVAKPWRHDLERIRAYVQTTANSQPEVTPKYGRQKLPAWAVLGRGAQIRYCPACLLECRYIRARWRLAAFEVCTIHGVRLKANLVEPAISAAYNRPGKWQIDQIPPEEIEAGSMCPLPLERVHVDAIWGTFERAVVGGETEVCQPLAWAILANRLLDVVVTAVRGPDYPQRDVPRAAHRAGWLARVGLAIAASPEGVLGFLLNLRQNAHRRAAATALRMIMGEEWRQQTLLSSLPLRHLHDRMIAAAPETQAPVCHGALARDHHPTNHVSLEKAEAIIGCQASLLYFLVREGFFESVKTLKYGRKHYTFIHRSEIETCRRWFSQCLSCEDLMSGLQIDRRGYWTLMDSQVLRPIRLGSRSWHRRQDVSALLCKLDEVARTFPNGSSGLYPLMGAWMHRRGRARTVLIQVVHEIFRGELPLYRKLDETGLRAYFVDVVSIERLRWLATAHQLRAEREASHAGQLCLLEG